MRKEERKERNDRQDTKKRKRRMEKRTYEGCKWKTEIMQEKEKNWTQNRKKMIKGEYIREGISLSTRKSPQYNLQ